MLGIQRRVEFGTFLTRNIPQPIEYIDAVNAPDVFADGVMPNEFTIDDINDGDITSGMLADAAVTTAKLADLSVDTDKLANLAVEAAKLAGSSVEASKIANAAVGSAAIASLAVGSAHIANGAIINAKIADASINNAKIANAAITNAKINDLSADKINAGTLTGRVVQSSSGGNRVVLNNGDYIEFYYGGSRQAYVRADSGGDFHIVANDDVMFNAGGGDRCGVYGNSFKPYSDNSYNLGESGKRWDYLYTTYVHCSDIRIDGTNIYPTSASGHHCGTSGNRWGEVYTNGCTGCAYKEMNLLSDDQKKRHKKKDKIDDYPIGMVLVMKEDSDELAPCNKDACSCVLGVGSNNGVPIVLGAEPVWVKGKIKKGQRLVTSMAYGRARGVKEGEEFKKSGTIFARAMESKDTEGNGVIKAYINITN